MLYLLQSVHKHVGRFTSKLRIPYCIWSTMNSFVSVNNVSRVSSQYQPLFFLRRFLNGCILSELPKKCDTWFIRPKNERMSVILFGVGNLIIASIIFLVGLMPVSVMVKPANSISSLGNAVGVPQNDVI